MASPAFTLNDTPLSNDPNEIEQTIEAGLEKLRHAPMSDSITSALRFLTPDGYRPTVQIEQVGPKKRGQPQSWHWNPESARIVLHFERLSSEPSADPHDLALKPPVATKEQTHSENFASPSLAPTAWITHEQAEALSESDSHKVTPLEIQQCCVALADAEKAGKAFIALKWFRDEALAKYKFDWTSTLESRQAVLTKAIESGAIHTSRIPNPKAPQHPTTTVALNRAGLPNDATSRFKPIAVRGEPASVSMMRDRGSF
jgi:hypothetical protein